LPGAEQLKSEFFSETFTALLSWRLPSHTGTCEPVEFSLFGQSFYMNSHCDIATEVFPYFESIMLAVWSVIAFNIVMRA
jgi:hypothetical protein